MLFAFPPKLHCPRLSTLLTYRRPRPVPQEKQAVQFLFEEPVTAFAAGRYGSGGSNAPCMAYAVVGKVVLFHNVRLPVMVTETLTDVMAREHPWPGEAQLTASQRQELYRWCLYGFPSLQRGMEDAGAEGEKAERGADRGREEAAAGTESESGGDGTESDDVPQFQPAGTSA